MSLAVFFSAFFRFYTLPMLNLSGSFSILGMSFTESGLELRLRNGQIISALIVDAQYLWVHWFLLRTKEDLIKHGIFPFRVRKLQLTLWPDALDKQDYRRFRMRLALGVHAWKTPDKPIKFL